MCKKNYKKNNKTKHNSAFRLHSVCLAGLELSLSPSCDPVVLTSPLCFAHTSVGRLTSCRGWMIQQVLPGGAPVWVRVNQLVLVSSTAEQPYSKARLQQYREVERAGGREVGWTREQWFVFLLLCSAWRGDGADMVVSSAEVLPHPRFSHLITVIFPTLVFGWWVECQFCCSNIHCNALCLFEQPLNLFTCAV